MSVGLRRLTGPGRLVFVALAPVLLLGACGGDDGGGSDATPDRGAAAAGLPFDLGPAVVRGGDDVVADGVDVADDRVVDEISDPPEEHEATVYRWVPSPTREAAVQAAVTELVGDPDVEIHVDGPRFEFEAEDLHGAEGAAPTTQAVPLADTPPAYDEDEARRRTADFLDGAGFDVDPDSLEVFDDGEFLSVESMLDLVGGTQVLRAHASLTFDRHGDVVGGFGPVGEAVEHRVVPVVDVDAALRRLALTRALAGYPTTVSLPTEPVIVVEAALVHSMREVTGADGTFTGETWLLPVYRLVDDTGLEHEVVAVAADQLRIP